MIPGLGLLVVLADMVISALDTAGDWRETKRKSTQDGRMAEWTERAWADLDEGRVCEFKVGEVYIAAMPPGYDDDDDDFDFGDDEEDGEE